MIVVLGSMVLLGRRKNIVLCMMMCGLLVNQIVLCLLLMLLLWEELVGLYWLVGVTVVTTGVAGLLDKVIVV